MSNTRLGYLPLDDLEICSGTGDLRYLHRTYRYRLLTLTLDPTERCLLRLMSSARMQGAAMLARRQMGKVEGVIALR
jgi:hypothetical protein